MIAGKSIDRYCKYCKSDARISAVFNDNNSGSPYVQWFKGISLARADLIWIAEADDFCASTFLEEILPYFRYPDVRLAYCASQSVGPDGRVHGDYRNQPYLKSVSPNRWNQSYIASADEEASSGLGVKCTVLNISSAVFRKLSLSCELRKQICSMIMAGDWLFMLECIRNGSIAFHSALLNSHRRHASSAIHKQLETDYLEVLLKTRALVHSYVRENFRVTAGYEQLVRRYIVSLAKEHAGGRWRDALSSYYRMANLGGSRHDSSKPESAARRHCSIEPCSLEPSVHHLPENPRRLASPLLFETSGFCPICETRVTFASDSYDFRHRLGCSGCNLKFHGSNVRERAVAYCINSFVPNYRMLRIHEIAPVQRGISRKLKLECSNYLASNSELLTCPRENLSAFYPFEGSKTENRMVSLVPGNLVFVRLRASQRAAIAFDL